MGIEKENFESKSNDGKSVELNESFLSDEEIQEVIESAGDDIENFLNETLPSLPPMYDSQGRPVDIEEVIKATQASREGLQFFLNSITNQYGLRDKIKDLIEVEQVTKKVESARDPMELLTDIVSELSNLRDTSGYDIDKDQLIRNFNRYLQDEVPLSSITRRYGFRKKAFEFKKMIDQELNARQPKIDKLQQNEQEVALPNQDDMKAEYYELKEEYHDLRRRLSEMQPEQKTLALSKMNQIAKKVDTMLKQIKDWN